MSFEKIKQSVADYDAVVIDSTLADAPNPNHEASQFSGEVFVWRSNRLRFNNRENQEVLRLVDKAVSWQIVDDCLIVCTSGAIMKAILAEPAPEPAPEPEPVDEPVVVDEPEEEVEDEDEPSKADRFKFWDEEGE